MRAEMPSEQSQKTPESWSEFAALVATVVAAKVASACTRAPQILRTILVTRHYRWAGWMVLMALIVGWDYGSDAAYRASALAGLALVAVVLVEIGAHLAVRATRGTKRVLKR